MRIGDPVKVKHGTGRIVGKDLPESQWVWRWIVQVSEPTEEHAEFISHFRDAQLCYFPEHVSAIS